MALKKLNLRIKIVSYLFFSSAMLSNHHPNITIEWGIASFASITPSWSTAYIYMTKIIKYKFNLKEKTKIDQNLKYAYDQ